MAAGLGSAKGGAAVVIDADLQDPPEVIPELLRCWQRGRKLYMHNAALGMGKVG